MANNLKILITGQLDSNSSLAKINAGIKELEKKVSALKLKVDIDPKVISTLNNFANQLQRISNVALKAGGNVQTSMNNANKGIQGQVKTLQELEQGYERVNKQVKKFADGSTKSTTTTLKDAQGNGRVVTQDGAGNVINYKDIQNIEKFQREQSKLRKSLIELGRTGKYATDELRNIGKSINLATTTKEIANLQNRMANMKLGNSLINDQERLRQSLKRVYDQGLMNEQRFSRFNNMINSSKNVAEIDKIKKAMDRVSDTGKNSNLQQKLLSQAQTLLGGNSKKLDVAGVNNLVNAVKNIRPNASSASNELKRLEQQLRSYQQEARVGAAHTLTFGSALKQALQGFSLWAMTAQMVYAPVRALQDMTQRLIEIDGLMTDIRRVMDMPDFRFTELLQEAVETSDTLSSKLTDVLKIMGDFGRMGFQEDQLVDITKTAQVLQNISDLDAESAVNTLTSAMLNFNIEAQDSIEIANKLNEVDNNFAVSTKDLSDGIRKASATAKTFGKSLPN